MGRVSCFGLSLEPFPGVAGKGRHRTEEEEADGILLSGADELRGLVDEGDEVGVFGGIATGPWGGREPRGPGRALPRELRALAGGGGPEEAKGPDEAPRGRHGGRRTTAAQTVAQCWW